MIKFLLVVKVCSALDGSCLPEQPVSVHDSWYTCAGAGINETISLMNIIGEDARKLFYDKIKDVCDPEKKRKVIGSVFIDVFSKIAKV